MPFISKYRLSNSTSFGFGLLVSTGILIPLHSLGYGEKNEKRTELQELHHIQSKGEHKRMQGNFEVATERKLEGLATPAVPNLGSVDIFQGVHPKCNLKGAVKQLPKLKAPSQWPFPHPPLSRSSCVVRQEQLGSLSPPLYHVSFMDFLLAHSGVQLLKCLETHEKWACPRSRKRVGMGPMQVPTHHAAWPESLLRYFDAIQYL